jgi:single-stranded DNA-binding protein
VIFSEGLGEIVEKFVAKGAKVLIEGALLIRKWQDSPVPTRYSTEIHLTQYNGTLTFLDARKDDARSSEQHATREPYGIGRVTKLRGGSVERGGRLRRDSIPPSISGASAG